jgi:hypothetical protein
MDHPVHVVWHALPLQLGESNSRGAEQLGRHWLGDGISKADRSGAVCLDAAVRARFTIGATNWAVWHNNHSRTIREWARQAAHAEGCAGRGGSMSGFRCPKVPCPGVR